ncbi:MAG: methyltransferase domain-containing protein [Bacteriovoracaceae bacterium]
MYIRNILLITSLTIIAFCLTLYFQSEQNVQSMSWDQYKNLQYNDDRSHSLEDLNNKIYPHRLQDIINEIYQQNRLAGVKTRVMEIGMGNGRVLMELKKKFPEVEFYGINKEKTHTFYRRESFILTALKFEIFSRGEIEDLDLPYAVFQDLDFGGKIPYEKEKFDLIYSQNTLHHIKYKFELFNEILRVLRLNGLSFHTDLSGVNIYSNGVLLPFKDAMGEIRKKGAEVQLLDNPKSIRFKKTLNFTSFPLTPHQPLPSRTDNLSQEMRRPDMGYNLN